MMQTSTATMNSPVIDDVSSSANINVDRRDGRLAHSQGAKNLGIYAYAMSGMVLGLTGLVWRDFATNWQHVTPTVAHREALACFAAAIEILAGSAILWHRTARSGAVILTCLFALFTALWVPDVVRAPTVYDSWGNLLEEFSLVAAGALAVALLGPRESLSKRKLEWLCRIYAVCPISFGIAHLVYFKGTATWVPAWIPPGQMFWTGATAVFFLMAAASILTGVMSGLASRLLFAQIAGFEVLIWIPKVWSVPHQHFVWAGNAISIALSAAAWLVSDVVSDLNRRSTNDVPMAKRDRAEL